MYWLKLRNIDQSKSKKLIFSFLVNSRWLEMGKMAKNGQNAISIHKNDIFPIIIPILGQNRLVLNNFWVFISFSIFGLIKLRNVSPHKKIPKKFFFWQVQFTYTDLHIILVFLSFQYFVTFWTQGLLLMGTQKYKNLADFV